MKPSEVVKSTSDYLNKTISTIEKVETETPKMVKKVVNEVKQTAEKNLNSAVSAAHEIVAEIKNKERKEKMAVIGGKIHNVTKFVLFGAGKGIGKITKSITHVASVATADIREGYEKA